MKLVNEFLSELLDLGIKLWMDGDRLRYNSPEGALTPEIRSELTARKAEIMATLKQSNLNHLGTSQIISPISRDRDLPLSFGQQRLWFVSQLDKNSTVYNESLSLKIEGMLQVDLLEKVFQEIWRRHEVLRTNFSVVDGSPVQVISPHKHIPLAVLNLQNLSQNDCWTEVERLTTAQNQLIFNLEIDALLRLTLIAIAEDVHILLLTIHHIIADGSFMSIFINEFTALYAAFAEGNSSPLPELSIQYADYAYWQRQRLQGELLEHHLNYWKQQLAGVPPYLELPTDRLRPPIQTFQGRGEQFQIDALLTQKLKQLSQKSGVTLFMTLLSAFTVLLTRYTNQTDIVIGSPIANRNSTELESLLGFFVNNLILRIQLQSNPTFTELLSQIRQIALDAFEHSEAPFEKIVDELQLERNLSFHPLFQVAFVLQNTPMWKMFQNSADGKLKISDLALSLLHTDEFKAKFDLTLEIVEQKQGLAGTFVYNTDLFDRETIQRMVDHFHILLESVGSNPQQTISQLPLLTSIESHQILSEWNNTKVDYPQNICIHELIEAQAAKTPDRIAIIFENEQLTYKELNQKANHLAHHLQKQGILPDQLIGICVERSLEMVIGLLGILKSGAAYVPLDPTYPSDRLAFMIADSQIPILITQQKLLVQIPTHGLSTVCLDADWDFKITPESDRNPISSVCAKNLCYIIYTSGSTGKPKGVMNQHRGVVNRLLWMQETYQLTDADRVLQKTPFSFDVSVWEFFLPLIVGARLVIAKPDGHKDSAYLVKLIAQASITTLHFVPSMLQIFLEEVTLSADIGLRQVFCSGEALPLQLQRRFFERLGAQIESKQCKLHNLYGPTEAAIDVSYWECFESSPLNIVPIGTPVANTQLYILDPELQPVPIGVAGELHIGGVQVARGYLNRPELTAEKFIPNPFSNDPEARLYKTGDLCRYLVDGAIEYLGRIDFQVKLRGFRVELGEIETVLAQHQNVREAIVILHEESPENRYLAAYIVPNQLDLDLQKLRQAIKKLLPEHMIPSVFVVLDQLPLSPNGKVDRRLLPDPSGFRSNPDHNVAIALTPIEDILVNIWNKILRLQTIGIHDNFFELGGHSLMVVQVMSRVREAFAVDLPIQILFQEPTIAALGLAIASELDNNSGLKIPPILRNPYPQILPTSFAQQRMWFLQQFDLDSATYNIPVLFRVTGSLAIAALETSLSVIVNRHETLRTSFIAIDGQPTSVISDNLPIAIAITEVDPEITHVSLLQTIEAEIRQPFNLSISPLFRVKLLQFSSSDHVLILNFHHIIIDGWSINIFLQELAQIYQTILAEDLANASIPVLPTSIFTEIENLEFNGFWGEELPKTQKLDAPFSNELSEKLESLDDLAIQYTDYAIWQRQWLQGDILATQMQYWLTQLSEPPTLRLPTDRPRPLVQTFRGAIQSFSLSADLTRQIKFLAKETATTTFMILLAAFQIMLSRHTGDLDIIVGTPIAGRRQMEIEKLIGLFVNSLAIRTDLTGNPTVQTLLTRIRDVTLAAYTHQDLPLEQVIEALKLKRNLSSTPLFQVMFSLINMPNLAPIFSDLMLTPIEAHTGTSRVDLTFELQETSDYIKGIVEYNSDLFDGYTIIRMSEHFQILLEGMVVNLNTAIADLPMLTASERRQILRDWHQTQTDYPRDRTIHQLFEQQVLKTPNAIAVVYGEQEISYLQLNQKANQLAHHLQSLGVKVDSLVGICLDPSIDLIVGLIGILKAGGAYVPIDASYPPERIDYMIEDAQVKLLVTNHSQEHKFFNIQIVSLDREWEAIAQASQANICPNIPAEIAYVIYTSGSTGQPKGVMVSHQAVNRLVVCSDYIHIRPEDAVAQASNVAFDAATFEIWGALLNGAKLIGITKEVVLSPLQLAHQIRQQRITVLFLTTAVFNLVAKQVPDAFKPLQTMLFGGEMSDLISVRAILEHGAPQRLLHVYGPTENTTFSSWYLVQSVDDITNLSIGKAIANSEIYILDPYLKPVPIGVLGELYVAGDGLAKCYLNRPVLTAEKFINHSFDLAADLPSDSQFAPFSSLLPDLSSIKRLYKTGDLGKYLPDGNVELSGRIDYQVKIRGFRIELGEIETILAQHPEISENLVVAIGDHSLGKQLVAYIISKNKALDAKNLRSFLKAKLPDYMIPAFFVFIDNFPLTVNGKVDRKALPKPDLANLTLEQRFEPPTTPTEEAIAKVWSEVLKLDRVGIHDNFFELGGHSLIATQVMSRLPQLFCLDFPLSLLFELPTISELAQRIDTILWSSNSDRTLANTKLNSESNDDDYAEGIL